MPQYKQSTNDRRNDGSLKGLGYLGALSRPDGRVSTELAMQTSDVNGQEIEIPLLVPTLSRLEVQYLLSLPDGLPDWKHPIMQQIADKATDFAKMRIAQGKPLFSGLGEEWPLYPDLQRVSVQQFNGDIALPNESGQRDPRLPALGNLSLPVRGRTR